MGEPSDFSFFPENFHELSIREWAGEAWETDFLWDQIHEQNISLFGYSMGGRMALSMLASYPDRVEKLILCGSQFCPPVDALERRKVDKGRADFLRQRPQAFLEWWATLDLFGPQDSSAWKEMEIKRANRLLKRSDFWADLMVAFSVSDQPDYSALIKNHAKKILFLFGEHDKKYCNFAEDYRAMGVETIAIPDAWHAVHLDNPDGLIDVICQS